ncbi:MAG: T9SS type A sorting domain-containing protein [Saprospiraceae bacterium]|nr:T9SS type A sorting domain-containing protein [Saprospiraceae bacterium]
MKINNCVNRILIPTLILINQIGFAFPEINSPFIWKDGRSFFGKENKHSFTGTRLCDIYGSTDPDGVKVIGEDEFSISYITDYYSPDGNGIIVPPTGITFLIHGTLVIDHKFRGNSLIFQMGNGAKIKFAEIDPNNGPDIGFYYFVNCKFFSCDKMWRGIECNYAYVFNFIKCKIEDAEFAIKVNSKVNMSLWDNIFSLNYVCITNSENTIRLGVCGKNIFRGDLSNEMRPFYNSDVEDHYDAETPYAGFLLNDCSINIGRQNDINTFKYLVYGIVAQKSHVTVNGCNFENIYGSTIDFLGAGIYAEESTIKCVKGIFNDVYFAGIHSYASPIDIQKSSFNHCTHGIFIEYAINAEKSIIKDNTFNMNSGYFQTSKSDFNTLENYGIWLQRPSGGAGLLTEIYRNKFNIGGSNTNAFSAWIVESGLSYGSESIRFNANKTYIISTADMVCGYKFNCFTSNFIQIDTDTFDFDNSSRLSMRNAITAHDKLGGNHRVINSLFKSNNTKTMNLGFWAQTFPKVFYCGNIFDRVVESFLFKGGCDKTILATSTFDNSSGLKIVNYSNNDPGLIGPQDRRGNVWDCPLSANTYAGENYGDPTKSRFDIETDHCTKLPTTGIQPGSGWFYFSGNTPNNCIEDSFADTCVGIFGFSDHDTAIFQGNYSGGPVAGLYRYNADFEQLYNIWTDTIKLQCDTLAEDYFIGKRSSTEGRLSQVLNEIRVKLEIPTGIKDTLDGLRERREIYLYSIDTLNENYFWQDSVEADSNYNAVLDSFLLIVSSLKIIEDSLIDLIYDYRSDVYDSLMTINSAISTDSVWETYSKFMNEFAMKVILNVVDSEDYDSAQTIAYKDYGDGGIAVLFARVWFPFDEEEEESLIGTKKSELNGEGLELSHTKFIDLTKMVEIYPIPVGTNQLEIRSDKGMKQIQILNLQGTVINTLDLGNVLSTRLKMEEYLPGVYYIRVMLSNGGLVNKQLIK